MVNAHRFFILIVMFKTLFFVKSLQARKMSFSLEALLTLKRCHIRRRLFKPTLKRCHIWQRQDGVVDVDERHYTQRMLMPGLTLRRNRRRQDGDSRKVTHCWRSQQGTTHNEGLLTRDCSAVGFRLVLSICFVGFWFVPSNFRKEILISFLSQVL